MSVSFSVSAAERVTVPKTRTVDQTDTYHGEVVADPYRWLEDDVRTSKEVADWVTAQNAATFAHLQALPDRETFRKRLTELWNYERFGEPQKVAGRYYFTRNSGLQNQAVLYVQDRLDSEPTVVIDPNTWSQDGTVALAGTSFSPDGRHLAYAVQDAGSDWLEWRILDLQTLETLDERLKWVKFNSPDWTPDGRGFFYSRFPTPEAGQAFQKLNLNQKVYYHRLGQPQAQDALVYERPDHPEWGFGSSVTEDGRYLVITAWVGTDHRYRVFYRDLLEPYAMPQPLIDHFDNEYSFLGNDGRWFYFQTDFQAPRRRVIAIPIDRSDPANWQEIVGQTDDTLVATSLVGNQFILRYLRDARSHVAIHRLDGRLVREVELPGLGTAGGFHGYRVDTETFYSFSSFATPPSLYRYDLLTGESQLWRRAKVDFSADDFVVEQIFYTSRDGTRVPMFLTYRRDLPKDGARPTLLYGYGGFNIPLTPGFSTARIAWLEAGGVLAVANLRGGGEYGEDWHQGGKKSRKQNVFDDFIAAAEWLIASGWTQPGCLGIQGGSNGGLLVGACLTQRPELFGACLPAVGVMDMLRFHQFTAGRYWVDEFGSADDPELFPVLRAYSPYHQIKPGVEYPPTLVTTADTDDRVVPGHSFKFAAALQAAQAGDAPVLIRIETRAGHGAGKPTSKLIEETADLWAFLKAHLRPRN